MKNFKYLILLTSLLLNTAFSYDRISIPLPKKYLSIENSGDLSSYDAFRDGVGIFISTTNVNENYSNQDLNDITYKYSELANNSNLSLKEYIDLFGTNEEKQLFIEKFKSFEDNNSNQNNSNQSNNGNICNDNNAFTVNDKIINGVCTGVDSSITVKCLGATSGSTFILNNKTYTVANNSNLDNLLKTMDHSLICTSNVTDLSGAFSYFGNGWYGAYDAIGDISSWDVSNVTSMNNMFWQAVGGNGLDLSAWDVSKVNNIAYMFYESFVDLKIGNWALNKNTVITNAFRYAMSMNDDLSNIKIESCGTNGLNGTVSNSEFFSILMNNNVRYSPIEGTSKMPQYSFNGNVCTNLSDYDYYNCNNGAGYLLNGVCINY